MLVYQDISGFEIAVVNGHHFAIAMLCHDTSQLSGAQSTVEFGIVEDGLATLHKSNAGECQ
jgi:hypothetical protein